MIAPTASGAPGYQNALSRGRGDEDLIVGVIPIQAAPLLKHAYDGERNLLNPDDLSSRIPIIGKRPYDPIPRGVTLAERCTSSRLAAVP